MKIRAAQSISIASYLGLIGWMMLWIMLLGGHARDHISLLLLLLVTPLLLPLRGVLAGRDKALIWGALVSLIYLVHGGMLAWSDVERPWFGLLELGLSIVFVISASFFIRWRATDAASDA